MVQLMRLGSLIVPGGFGAAGGAAGPPGTGDFLASKDASNSATLDFTEFNAAKYDSYYFALQNIVPATEGTSLSVRTSTDGGTNYDAAASDYETNRAARFHGSANDSWLTRGSATATEIALAVTDNQGSGAGEDGLSGYLYLHGPHLAKRTMFEFYFSFITAILGGVECGFGTGMRDSAADVDAIRFFFLVGNIESGTISMYGLPSK